VSGVCGGRGASGDDKRVKRGTKRAKRRPVEGAPRRHASRDGKRRAPARGAGRSRGSIRGGARRRDPGRNARRTDGDVHEGVADDGELDLGGHDSADGRSSTRPISALSSRASFHQGASCRRSGRATEGGARRRRTERAGRTRQRFRRDAARADDERRHDVSTALRTFLKSIDRCERTLDGCVALAQSARRAHEPPRAFRADGRAPTRPRSGPGILREGRPRSVSPRACGLFAPSERARARGHAPARVPRSDGVRVGRRVPEGDGRGPQRGDASVQARQLGCVVARVARPRRRRARAASAPPDPAGGTNNRVSPAPALAPSSR
jgi:hypothetical protein